MLVSFCSGLSFSACLSLQLWGLWLTLWLQVSDGSKKSSWFSVWTVIYSSHFGFHPFYPIPSSSLHYLPSLLLMSNSTIAVSWAFKHTVEWLCYKETPPSALFLRPNYCFVSHFPLYSQHLEFSLIMLSISSPFMTIQLIIVGVFIFSLCKDLPAAQPF